MFSLVRTLWEAITLPKDQAPDATAGLPAETCGFTQAEIDAAPAVELLDLDEGD